MFCNISSDSVTPSLRPRLSAARHRAGWSQQVMADRLGTTPLNISRWERGLTTPSPYYRQRLTDLFGVGEADLDIFVTRSLEDDESQREASPLPGYFDPALPHPGPLPLLGRSEEFAALKASLLECPTGARAAVCGLPGIGKTALCVALSHDLEIRERFADGILWATLGPDPNLLAHLGHWGSVLGGSEGLMSKLQTKEEWIQTLQSVIGQRHLLMVFDDAWSYEDVRSLQIGGPYCGYLLATRQPLLALRFAPQNVLTIHELDASNSKELLRHLCPEVVESLDKHIQELIDGVGGLPLALMLIGNYLSAESYSHQSRRIKTALTHLKLRRYRLQLTEVCMGRVSPFSGNGMTSLQEVIAPSVEQLPKSAQRALLALSNLSAKPASFTEAQALAMCREPVEVLDTLTDAGLLESLGDGRYCLHPTIADYAALCRDELSLQGRTPDTHLRLVQEEKEDDALLSKEWSLANDFSESSCFFSM